MRTICGIGLTALAVFLPAAVGASTPRNVIVDTDAGSDDLMAIAFLLSRADVHIEAITVVNGIAHVDAGATNILRILELAGKPDIPVYIGRGTPLAGSNAFPDSWRITADSMPSVSLPQTERKPRSDTAVDDLMRRLRMTSKPVSILALGPLTNVAEALASLPRGAYPIEDFVIMGGAVRVEGNLAAGNILETNKKAEWNIYIDPRAARKVMQSGVRFRLVPLDACNRVPVDSAFVEAFAKRAKTPLGKVVVQLLEASRVQIDAHIFYAWDPLAAVALVNSAVLKISSLPIEILEKGPNEGETLEDPNSRNMVRVALDAESASFRKAFFDAFAVSAR